MRSVQDLLTIIDYHERHERTGKTVLFTGQQGSQGRPDQQETLGLPAVSMCFV